jgi:hypothetical protein
VLGAIAIVAVYVSYAKPDDASAPALVNNVAAATSTRPAVVPERAMAEHRKQQQARRSSAEDTALIARLPVGRPDSVDLAKLPAHPATSHVPESVSSTHIPPVAVETSPDLRTGDQGARTDSGRARARQEKASTKLIGRRDLVHRERRERSIGTAAAVVQWKNPLLRRMLQPTRAGGLCSGTGLDRTMHSQAPPEMVAYEIKTSGLL